MEATTHAWARTLLATPGRSLALALADAGAPSPQATAWAFKDLCYAAWSTEPAQARPCADRVAELLALEPAHVERQALAAWTAGIAALAEGRMPDALVQLEAAHAAFGSLGQVQYAAQTLVPQMVALAMLGRYEQALQMGQRALMLFTQAGDAVAAGKVEINLGTMLSRRDRHAEAAPLYRRASVRFARARDNEASVLADLGLANALTWQFEFAEAQRITRRALMRARTHGLRVPQALAHLGLGRQELLTGQVHQALRELVLASRLFRQAGAAPQQRLEADAALADAYMAVNLLPEAVALYDRLETLATDIDAPVERARALLERSRALTRLAQPALARADLEVARALFLQADNRASVAGADLALAAQHLQAGRGAEALSSAVGAGQALQGSGIVGWQCEARALEAAARAQCGQVAAAKALFLALLDDAAQLPPVLLSCQLGLSRLAWQAQAPADARRHADAALRLVEEARATLPADEFRAAVAADAEQAQALWLKLALEQGDAATVLEAIERGRARALHLGLQKRATLASVADRDVQLQWLRQRWREAVVEGEAERAADWVQRLRGLEAELLEVHRRHVLSAAVDVDARSRPDAGPAPFATAALQAALCEHEAFVVYQLEGRQLLVCVVTSHGVQLRHWDAGDLGALVQGLRFQIEAVRFVRGALASHGPQLMQRVQAHLHKLHRAVWAPIQPLLAGCSRVVLAPHRDLHYLPFAALHDGQRSLLEQFEIELAPSAAVWLAGQARVPLAQERLLALGSDAGQLTHVAAELDAVAQAYGPRALCLHGAAATAQALREGAQGEAGADVLHLACHGEFRADSPAFSALSLADGPLALHELSDMQLRARLVVLSACDTGQSRIAPGDELMGLVRGCMLAGASQVLATLWAVDDAASAQLMGDFHRRLAAGQRCSEALRAAQLTLVREGQHPFFWAAWALHGRG